MSNLQPFTTPTFLPTSYGVITDGGHFGDGATHAASSNGFSTLAALQTQFKAASFTATGSGTNLTVTAVTGALYAGLTLGVTTGIGSGITIKSQTSGTIGGAGVYVTSSATTISAAPATASWAASTSDDMAGLMLQAAVHAADTNAIILGGTVPLWATIYGSSSGLILPYQTHAFVRGYNATILCPASVTAGNPGLSVLGAEGIPMQISGVSFNAFATLQYGSVPGTGAPNTGIYTAGSIGAYHVNCLSTSLDYCTFNNWDQCHVWDQPTGNNYCWSIEHGTYSLNNKAAVFDQPGAANSGEKQGWRNNCVFGSNNYAAYINVAGTYQGGFGGTAAAMDIYFDFCSFDYSCVQHIWYNGGASTFDNLASLYCDQCHFETNNGTTGTNARVINNGAMVFSQCVILETDTPSANQCFIFCQTQFTTQTIIACKAPGLTSDSTGILGAMAFVISGYATNGTQGYGNFGRGDGQYAILQSDYAASYAMTNSFNPTDPASVYPISGATAYILATMPRDRDILLTESTNIEVYEDSVGNLAVGSCFHFVIVGGATGTFVANTGVSISGTLTFGGSGTARGNIIKSAANAWDTY
jgi:hypothetical protein